MARQRPRRYSSLVFVHRDHEFSIVAVPLDGGIELQISDRHGRIMLPLSVRISDAGQRREPRMSSGPVTRGMAELRKSIEELDDARFQGLLAAPRAASEYQWTPAELDAASRIDWSNPAAVVVHEGYRFAIGAFVTDERMVLLLHDDRGPFDAPMSIPKDSVLRAWINGRDPLAIGVGTMTTQIRSWSASRTSAFIQSTPRLALHLRRIN